MLKVFLATAAVAWAGIASAADQLNYGPAPAWVKPQPIPTPSADGQGVAVQLLLEDLQQRFGPQSDALYSDTAMKVMSPQALGPAGNIAFSWNPEIQTITVHAVHIIRGGQVIDVLAGGKKFTVLRRETNLEAAMLDGTLTATIQPEGLQVGDVVELALTQERHDPVFQGRSEGVEGLVPSGITTHVHLRASWADGKPIHWRTTDGLEGPKVTDSNGQTELVYDLTNVEAPKPPAGAPLRFHRLGMVEFSQFTDWAEVSALMAPLYAKAEDLPPNSPLLSEIEKIRASSDDPKLRAEAALKLVQEQTRYVFLGMNLGGLVPAAADLTWSRRFGDCKGKTALLLAVLKRLGVEAQPALVATTGGDGLDERLPMLGVFDHVMVRAVIGGKVYWLDGTRLGDRDIDRIDPPDFGWVLPVQATGGKLVKIDQPPLAEPADETLVRLDATAGLDSPSPAHVEELIRGDGGLGMHLGLAAQNQADADRSLREYWKKQYSWIEAKKVDASYDEVRKVMRLTMDGAATMDWSKYGVARDFDIGESSLGWTKSYKREPGPHQDAPYSVSHPTYQRWLVTITLPQRGVGFSLLNSEDVDKTMAGMAFKRTTRLENGVVVMDASQRSVAPEFPAAQAEQASKDLHELAKYDVQVRASTVATAQSQGQSQHLDPDSLPPPTDADGFSRRGVVYLRNREFDLAVADFSKAAQLQPTNPQHIYNRGVARFEAGRLEDALVDFSDVLKQAPGDTLALTGRASIYLLKGQDPSARKDFDEAVRLSPGDVRVLMREAQAYTRARRYDTAVAQYDAMIAQHPADPRIARMLVQRCDAVSRSTGQLQTAASDCDAALKAQPEDSLAMQGRGLVSLRLGRTDDAISLFGEALQRDPKLAIALYGRGLAERREGLKSEAETDLAAAKTHSAGVAEEFAAMGLNP
jgi:tetratricopeptide (TPR) repeat protein